MSVTIFGAVIRDAAAQGLLWGIMALGVYISYKVLDIADLSVDGTFALGGAVAAFCIARFANLPFVERMLADEKTAGFMSVVVAIVSNPFTAVLLSTIIGLLAGSVTGLLHTRVGIPTLLAGILMQLALYSVNLAIMGRANVAMGREYTTVFTLLERVLPVNRVWVNVIVGLLFCAGLIALLYWFFGTEIGCALRATGDNSNMARALGTNTNGMVVLGLALSNGFVALSGGLVSQSQGYADVGMGAGTIVIGLASIIIGGSLFRFMRGNFFLKMLAVILGSITYRIAIAVVLQLGMPTDYLKLLTAALVAVALGLSHLFKKRQKPLKLQNGEGK